MSNLEIMSHVVYYERYYKNRNKQKGQDELVNSPLYLFKIPLK